MAGATPLAPDSLQAKRIKQQQANPGGDKPQLDPATGKKPGLVSRIGQGIKQAVGGGLATATRNDPNAGALQKGAAVTGALAGRALGGAFKVAGQAISGIGSGLRGDGGKKGTPPEGGTQGGTTQTSIHSTKRTQGTTSITPTLIQTKTVLMIKLVQK